VRSELTQLVGDKLGLSENVAADRLAQGGRAAPIRPANGAPSGRSFAHSEETERQFLALCLALPQSGPDRLAAIDPDVLFASDLGRRAAAHLRVHFGAPMAGLASEDPLSGLMAELLMRARALEDPDPARLDYTHRVLDLARLDRQIAAARAAGTPVSDLAVERQEVRTELGKLTV
jgi:hypothetical protein